MFKVYESKPKKIEAIRFTNDNKDQVLNELTGQHAIGFVDGEPSLKITTMHGDIAVVRLGDWIVKDAIIGTYYPVKDEVFRASYA